jgi:hypothetical protein
MMIADQLGEHDEARRQYIVYLVRTLGRTQARKLLRETLEGEEQGEVEVPKSEVRSRTPSEIYFHLAETKGKPKRDGVLKSFSEMQTLEPEEQPGLPNPVEVAYKIAEQLKETGEAQLQQIMAIVRAMGVVQAWALMMDAIELDQGEGMMVPNGSRRRTVGGVFFHLAYTKGQPLPGKTLSRFPAKKVQGSQSAPSNKKLVEQRAGTSPAPEPPQPEPIPPFIWEDRITVIQEAEKTKGQASVKITVIGRPGKVEEKGQCVVTVMESTKVPALPKGLPTPPAAPTKYVVYVAAKQWKKVAEAIKDPEDSLIIEGFPTIDTQTNTIAVFATNTSTKKLQQAQRGKQQETTA